MTHSESYLAETVQIAQNGYLAEDIERMAVALSRLKGKLYIAGMGGSMANAIHMAADLRKLCDIDAEAFDNIAELTARANDEGLDTIFVDWLKRGTSQDALMVLSVGGGDRVKPVSEGLCKAFDAAQKIGMKTMAIVGYGSNQRGGYVGNNCDIAVRIPYEGKHVTPHAEAFQAVAWHCLVSHPLLQKNKTKW